MIGVFDYDVLIHDEEAEENSQLIDYQLKAIREDWA